VCKTAIEILDEMGVYQQLLDENKAKIVSTGSVPYLLPIKSNQTWISRAHLQCLQCARVVLIIVDICKIKMF